MPYDFTYQGETSQKPSRKGLTFQTYLLNLQTTKFTNNIYLLTQLFLAYFTFTCPHFYFTLSNIKWLCYWIKIRVLKIILGTLIV